MTIPKSIAAAAIVVALIMATPNARSETLEALRDLHSKAIADADFIEPAMTAVTDILKANPKDAVAEAYRGSLLTLMAREAVLPWNKLNYLHEGIATMDEAAGHLDAPSTGPSSLPADLEIRMVRGITNAMIPASYDRAPFARDDLERVVVHPAFGRLSLANRADAQAWLAVVLARLGKTAQAEEHLAAARAADSARSRRHLGTALNRGFYRSGEIFPVLAFPATGHG